MYLYVTLIIGIMCNLFLVIPPDHYLDHYGVDRSRHTSNEAVLREALVELQGVELGTSALAAQVHDTEPRRLPDNV